MGGRALHWLLVWLVVTALAPSASAATNVAVFNFQMTSDTPDWRWLEKGLADRIATDFVRAPGLSVIARDEMQLLAQKMNWVPEMATTDPDRMREIRKALTIEQLISGIYAVEGDSIRITGQIVDVESRMELARKEVEGPLEDVLDLQRKLSAELLAWFTRQEPAKILETLPVWTRSVPAMRALYEGMDLYDQGRYGEAWLRFRQASRDDPQYVEAVYWVGKMYYFMDRYEHARRTFEEFIYADTVHPRVGDAIKEYVHTYEKLDTSPETLLALYDWFAPRYPEAVIHETWRYLPDRQMPAEQWLRLKASCALASLGRYREAADRADRDGWGTLGCSLACWDLQQHHMLTGETWIPDWLLDWDVWQDGILRFSPDQTETETTLAQPTEGVRKHPNSPGYFYYQPRHSASVQDFYLVASSGYVFKTLVLKPVFAAMDGRLRMSLSKDDLDDTGCQEARIPEAQEKGLTFAPLPRTGWLRLRLQVLGDQPGLSPRMIRLHASATLEKVGDYGMVDVACANTSDFTVLVDGLPGRQRAGLIGLLPAGPHTLTFRPIREGGPYGPSETEVFVQAGQTVCVEGRLPFKDGASVAAGGPGILVGRGYQGQRAYIGGGSLDRCAIQADGRAVRLVWSYDSDLWVSESTDGVAFAPPRRLPIPISTGWAEQSPLCFRDESGRFVLMFISNRGAQHSLRPYVSWSRDFIHWSAPVALPVSGGDQTRLLQDRHGRYLLAYRLKDQYRIDVSRDLYHWENLTTISLPVSFALMASDLLERDDGTYELLLGTQVVSAASGLSGITLWRTHSPDAIHWPRPQHLWEVEWDGIFQFSATQIQGRTVLACSGSRVSRLEHGQRLYAERGDITCDFRWDGLYLRAENKELLAKGRKWGFRGEFSWCGESRTFLFEEDGEGRWSSACDATSVICGFSSLAWHPRWGYLLATMAPEGNFDFPHPMSGPFFFRYASLAPLFAKTPPEEEEEEEEEKER